MSQREIANRIRTSFTASAGQIALPTQPSTVSPLININISFSRGPLTFMYVCVCVCMEAAGDSIDICIRPPPPPPCLRLAARWLFAHRFATIYSTAKCKITSAHTHTHTREPVRIGMNGRSLFWWLGGRVIWTATPAEQRFVSICFGLEEVFGVYVCASVFAPAEAFPSVSPSTRREKCCLCLRQVC